MNRRHFLKLGSSAAASALGAACSGGEPATPPPPDGWNAGPLQHLLPSASHERFRIKASFARPLPEAPVLAVGGSRVPGVQTDTAGRFFRFDAINLAPATRYELQIFIAGEAVCDEWPLATFPAPDASPESLRLLVYTCAGGPDDLYNFGWFNAYLPIAHRQRLFARALSFAPDAAIAIGDHVYWDMKSKFGWAMGQSPRAWWNAGFFERLQPILGTSNEQVLHKAFGPQIAGLYGVRFRSTPMSFLQDDHDYGENDEASEDLRTFPADPFMLDLARTTQRLYYPELFAPADFPAEYVAPGGLAENFGSLRYGDLFEAALYDCRRFLTNERDPLFGHTESQFIPADVERWLKRRTAASDAAFFAHVPSTPLLWTAGKWAEWYPDFEDDAGALNTSVSKPYWPAGWRQQHDRLLVAASERSDRAPLFMSGDLHATAAGRILATGDTSLAENPAISLLVGAVGTGKLGWPSQFRGQVPVPSGTLDAEEWVEPIEENGFSLIDVEPGVMRVSMFRWTPEQGAAAIDSLEPFQVLEIPRAG